MWMVENHTPYAADRNWVRDKHGAHHFVVAVKASFEIGERGALTLADEQEPPALAPEYLGDDGASSLRCDTDLGPVKRATDVLVHGLAHAPKGRPIPEVAVGLRAGPINKVLTVRGENVYFDGPGGLETTTPRPFQTMPVVWERAYGGYDNTDPSPMKHRMEPRNPIGVGISAQLVHTPGPNVLYPGQAEAARPAGLLPVPGHWAPRLRLAGTFDGKWVEDRKPLLPLDYDERFTSSAPRDQQVDGYLPAGSRIQVVHMCPQEVLAFNLPAVELRFSTRFGSRTREHGGHLTTVLIEPELRTVRMVWQTSVPVASTDVEYLDATTVTERGTGS